MVQAGQNLEHTRNSQEPEEKDKVEVEIDSESSISEEN